MRERGTLHHLLSETAHRDPHQVAVVDGDDHITYADLDERSNQLAHVLLDSGVAPGDRVGLYLDKSADAIAGLYGILKAGAAYVPFDPQGPTARLAYIARDCGIRVVVSSADKGDACRSLRDAGAPISAVVTTADAMPAPTSPVAVATGADDLAYVLYTSGSTGNPKGVVLSHGNGLAFVRWAVDEFAITAADRLSSHAPLHFDLSIFDIFAAAAGGSSLIIVPSSTAMFPAAAARLIVDQRITVWYSVPSALTMLVTRAKLTRGGLPSLRLVLFAGETFPTKYLRLLAELVPGARLINLYGPTETNVCTWHEVTEVPETDEPIPIGVPIAGADVIAVTEANAPAEVGEVGELYVRGSTVMQGYWGDRQRTADALVRWSPAGVYYRTGDLARQDAGGRFHLVGRRDHQVKTRGYRVELGEIETALYSHPLVTEACVVAVPDDLVTNRLVAFAAAAGADEQTLRDFCRQRLPYYMVPDRFEIRVSLPKTSTGKIDRLSLTGIDRSTA